MNGSKTFPKERLSVCNGGILQLDNLKNGRIWLEGFEDEPTHPDKEHVCRFVNIRWKRSADCLMKFMRSQNIL